MKTKDECSQSESDFLLCIWFLFITVEKTHGDWCSSPGTVRSWEYLVNMKQENVMVLWGTHSFYPDNPEGDRNFISHSS